MHRPPRWSAGRRWALRHWARASRKRQPLVTGDLPWTRKDGPRKPVMGPRKPLAPPGAPFPCWGTEKGTTARPAPQNNPGGEALAKRAGCTYKTATDLPRRVWLKPHARHQMDS
jgi:hypothetical protein